MQSHASALVADVRYFALPTRTAATQIHDRLVKDVQKLFPDPESRPPVTLAVPGYLAFDQVKGTRLSRFEVLWDDDGNARAMYRGWASEHTKRYLAGSIVVGTVDQVLLSRLMAKHAHIRATALLRHLLVVDEVHASDAYMMRLVEEVLKWHLRAGGHALLMSATLGGVVREQFLCTDSRLKRHPNLEECRSELLPLISYKDRTSTSARKWRPPANPERAKTIKISVVPLMFDARETAALAFNAASKGAHVLCIRNTVGECLRTQSFLEELSDGAHIFRCKGVAAPHHSRFAQADRTLLDEAVEAHFGKRRSQSGVALISTQTIQQSLDLDADLLITDLCPMDVFLQRLGRLFRHIRKDHERPEGYRSARVIVLVPDDRDLGRYIKTGGKAYGPCGMGTVYEDLCILEATWKLLEQNESISVPKDCRALVEDALHPDVLWEIANRLGGAWGDHRNHVIGTQTCHGRAADMNLVNLEASFDEQGVLFPGGSRDIPTRLGEGDRWIRFAGPFGEAVETLTLPAYQARGMGDELTAENVVAIDGGVRFSLDGRGFIYDRLGLRPVDTDDKDDEDRIGI